MRFYTLRMNHDVPRPQGGASRQNEVDHRVPFLAGRQGRRTEQFMQINLFGLN